MTDKQRIKQIIEIIIDADDKDRFEQLDFYYNEICKPRRRRIP